MLHASRALRGGYTGADGILESMCARPCLDRPDADVLHR